MPTLYESLYGIDDELLSGRVPVPGQQTTPYHSGTTLDDRIEIANDPKSKNTLRFEPWQFYLVNRILNNADTFVSVPPSRGKTFPVLAAVQILFLRYVFKKSPIAPSVLFVVPRQQLAAQIAQTDFIRNCFVELIHSFINESNRNHMPSTFIVHSLNETFNLGIPLDNPIFNFLKYNGPESRREDIQRNKIELFAQNLVDELVGGSTSRGNNFVNPFGLSKKAMVTVATYDIGKKLILSNPNEFNYIFIDEFQELIPHPHEPISDSLEERFISAITIIKNAPRNSSITLMTGSINNNTIGKIIDEYINPKYKRKFEIFPKFSGSFSSLNRSEITLRPLTSISGFPNISGPKRLNLCKDIIVQKQNNSIMIIFSVQKTGQGIFKLIEDLTKSLPPRPESAFLSSSKIKAAASDSRINSIINNNAPSTTDDNFDINFLKWFDFNTIYSKGNAKGKIVKDEGNILYQGVLRGVAPLVGSMLQIHKKVIQQLFIEGKIQLLLATDALGVGANVRCRDIYIPSIDKFDGAKLQKVDESSLTQLIHRAGRGAFENANVYCSIQDYDYIWNLIFNDPRKVVPEIDSYTLNNLFKLEAEVGEKTILKVILKNL